MNSFIHPWQECLSRFDYKIGSISPSLGDILLLLRSIVRITLPFIQCTKAGGKSTQLVTERRY